MTLEEFRAACTQAVAERPECVGWTLAVKDGGDFQREWVVTTTAPARATPGGPGASVTRSMTVIVPSASATTSTAAEVIGQLIRKMNEP